MYRAPLRAASSVITRQAVIRTTGQRCSLSTAPPHRQSRSWKSSFARWGLAGAIVYYYNTSSVFADEPYVVHTPPQTSRETETYPTIDLTTKPQKSSSSLEDSKPAPVSALSSAIAAEDGPAGIGPAEDLEEEAAQQGAFNEETGEINWDCPCLGGMAYGPCGEQFRAAFSCFVFSKEDPKGMECIDHFKTMQNCFREHPDIYGSELEEDEVAESIDQDSKGTSEHPAPQLAQRELSANASSGPSEEGSKRESAADQKASGATPGSDVALPRSAHDAR